MLSSPLHDNSAIIVFRPRPSCPLVMRFSKVRLKLSAASFLRIGTASGWN